MTNNPDFLLFNIKGRPLAGFDGKEDYESIMMAMPHDEIEERDNDLEQFRDLVAQYVDDLDPREQWILNACISEGKSLQTIANELSLTKTHIWRLRNQAFNKLKELMSFDTTIRRRVKVASTWEESATQWMVHISEPSHYEPIDAESMLDTIAYLGDTVMAGIEPQSEAFTRLAKRTVSLARDLGNWDTGEMLSLLISKQKDYGHGNINSFGIIGIVVRLSDKVERYKNLTSKKRKPKNETLVDTVHDIIGYCVIALMFLDETFQLPLGDEK
jgi:hypothetical protein